MALFFKQPSHRRFNYTPRIWNPEEEARIEREKRIKAELGEPEDSNIYVHNVREGLRKEYKKRTAGRKKGILTRSTRLFLILIMLLLGVFYLLTYKLEAIFNFFYK